MSDSETETTKPTEFDEAAAYFLASKFVLIPNFPRDRATVEHVADWLMEFCIGIYIDGQHWSPKEQATWTAETAIKEFENWDRGGGLKGVKAMFDRKFKPPPALKEYQMLPKPEIACTICNDQGTVVRDDRIEWCSCEQARLLRVEAPNVVNVMNRQRERQAAKEERRRELKAKIKSRFAERRQHAETDIFAPGAVPLVRRPRLLRMLRDWAGRVLRKRAS